MSTFIKLTVADLTSQNISIFYINKHQLIVLFVLDFADGLGGEHEDIAGHEV